jgi:hypothetical protein
MERIRISKRRSRRRVDDAVDDTPTQRVVSTDDAAELVVRIDVLLDK